MSITFKFKLTLKKNDIFQVVIKNPHRTKPYVRVFMKRLENILRSFTVPQVVTHVSAEFFTDKSKHLIHKHIL